MKIGIALLDDVYEYDTIYEAMKCYCKKYNVDTIQFVGFKGTDKNMCCREFQYMLGYNQDYSIEKPLMVCHRGLHFCLELDNVFGFYSLRGFSNGDITDNRYFIVLPEGLVQYGDVIACSNVLNILTEIPRDVTEDYNKRIKNGESFFDATMRSGLYTLVNAAVQGFIARNYNDKNAEDEYVNLIGKSIERVDIYGQIR